MGITTQKRSIKAIRLDAAAIEQVGKQLEAMQRPVKAERRKAPRVPARLKACILHLPRSEMGDVPAYLTPARNISNSGITFLHGAFIYPGSKAIIQLMTSDGRSKNMVAQIVHSTYVCNSIHNTGAKFQSPLDTREFTTGSTTTRIMIVEDNPVIAAMTEQHLSEMDAEIHVAKTGEAAIEAANSQVFDAVLMDMQLPGIDGFETTRRLRSQGFVGTIVAATGMTKAGVKEQCIAAGCNAYLPKPIGREQLAALLASLREAPMVSTLREDIVMKPLIQEFVADLPLRVREIETAYADGDMEKLQSICRSLKGEAGAFGFDSITQAASVVEKGVIDGQDQVALKPAFDAVIRLCCQVRAASDD